MFLYRALFLASVAVHVKGQGIVEKQDPNAACTLCDNGQDPILEPTMVRFSGPAKTCSELVADLGAVGGVQGDAACKDRQLYAFQIGCCDLPPFEYCTVCANNETFSNNKIPLGQADEPTCKVNQYRIDSLNGIFVPGACNDTFLQRSSFYCGCPDVEQQCTLCSNGQPAPKPRKKEKFQTNANCMGVEYLFSVFRADECSGITESFGVDFAAWCECPGTQMNQTACEVCSGGGTLTNPDTVISDPTAKVQLTCGDAQDFSKVIVRAGEVCDRLILNKTKNICKCESGAFGLTFVASLVMAGAFTIFGWLI